MQAKVETQVHQQDVDAGDEAAVSRVAGSPLPGHDHNIGFSHQRSHFVQIAEIDPVVHGIMGNPFGAGVPESVEDAGGRAHVAGIVEDTDLGMLLGEFLGDFSGAVTAAIVDRYDFEALAAWPQGFRRAGHRVAGVFRLNVCREGDRNFHGHRSFAQSNDSSRRLIGRAGARSAKTRSGMPS